MSSIITSSELDDRLTDLLRRSGIPGASVAVAVDGRSVAAAAGVVNAETGVEATPEALFQVGSITKVYVATAVLALVAQGRLDLDRPVRTWLPELRLGDDDVAAAVTPRHLLTHTSGIAGDFFPDTGRGDDALERFVAEAADLGQDVGLGSVMSYSNTGFCLLGRLVEVVTGEPWDAAMRALVYAPAELEDTVTLPEQALAYRAAFGHVLGADGRPALVDEWDFPRAAGPAGGICATASDLVAFARSHLAGRVLPGALADAMLEPQVTIPDRWSLGDHCGLAWMLRDAGGRRVHGHDGNGMGQAAFLRVVPDRGVAIALMTNGGDDLRPGHALVAALLRDLAAIELPAPPRSVPGDPPGPAATYERFGVRMEIGGASGAGRGRIVLREPLASQMPGQPPVELLLSRSEAGDDVLLAQVEGTAHAPAPLVRFEDDGVEHVHFGGRAMRRVA
ncbi:MAG TPA: serine hydrolase domain-containing protein [Baekduia sp.]|uniref:serine hydrolase domain-containing protein n=1 Tax=Baekduia sp. TaxID=2600305 RepID=UPI002D7A3BB4|nr:serine hydrolase domain-containing protein [Baekduia sp.]HET6505308.1 serine hydrolase domain-containing protein [Baekduia sp.]